MMNGHSQRRVPRSEADVKFTELFTRYSKLVQAYCARRVERSLVADAVADTFLVAWRRLDQIDDVDNALPWLYGTAYRVILHHWRSTTRATNLLHRLDDGDVGDGSATEAIVIRRQDSELVLLAASRLNVIDREILRLEFWEGLSHADVAKALAITPQAIRQRAYRARRNLTIEYGKLTSGRRQGLLGRVLSHAH
jgi:RNA polymerase sigma factor (sigma-70 family)